MTVIRRFKTEAMWLGALIVVGGWMMATAPGVEARSVNCIYHQPTNWCYPYPVDCLCDI